MLHCVSFCHENKFPVCVNIPANKADSDSDSVHCLAVNGTVTSLPVFTQNILKCVLKTNKDFTGLERHEGK